MRWRLVVLMLAAVPAAVAIAGTPGAGQPETNPLREAVIAQLPAPGDSVDTQVNVVREGPGDWAFGTAVLVAPALEGAYPEGWLWVAHRDGGWRVAVEGTAAFADLSRQAPLLVPAEREALTGLGALPESAGSTTPDFRTGMRLPYAVGQAWRYTGGPHPMSGNARSSIDLAGGDGRVLAVRDGLAYTMCASGTGWIRVVHDRGFATDYYHLEGNISADGRKVTEGTFLGNIGNDVSCGGRSTGAHVHFSLRRDGGYVPIDRYNLGKWSIRAGARGYEGFARYGSTRVDVGGTLRNHGALRLTEAVVDTNGGGVLNQRAGPGTDHAIIGTLADGETVRVRCSARGTTTHTGRDGYRSDLWNRLAGGGWVSDVYLWTGTGDPVNGRC